MDDRAEWHGRTFKSGNSVALRLPKDMGVPEGTEVRMVRESGMTFRVEPLDAPKRKIDIRKFAGKAPWLKERSRDGRVLAPRALDWDGALLKRDD